MNTFEILNGTQLNKLDRDITRLQMAASEYHAAAPVLSGEFGKIVSDLKDTVAKMGDLYNFNMKQRDDAKKARIAAMERSVQQAKAKLGMVV